MFGLGWSEMVLLGIVALIVIGPKDLPNMFRELGRMSGKARAMASEFSRAMEAAADDSGVKDISKSIQAAANPAKFGLDKAREAVGMTHKPGTETAKLSAERQAAKDKITAATAKAAETRLAREAADAAELSDEPEIVVEAPKVAADKPAKAKAPDKPKTHANSKASASKVKPAAPKPAKVKPTETGDA